ncbi:MAG: hypothetical protein JSV49_01445 [Thermoplasmata archaeon]|nr:MAG: hypothetical protein JSV49_01445 [Thermoplasmata archaeon]
MRINRDVVLLGLFLAFAGFVVLLCSVEAWEPTPVKDDQNLYMPGTQPGEAGTFETPDKCDNCHGGYDQAVEPAYNWRGSMMAQAARDPLWMACLTSANQDSIYATGNPNAGDLCIRCHSPTGWLEGRSEPTNTNALRTSDFDGVQCDFCHRMIDPFAALNQPDVPAETDNTAKSMAQTTRERDLSLLSKHHYFDGTPFLDPNTNLPKYYGDGTLPNYVEHGSGQFFVDSGNAKSGPYFDASARHKMYYSRHHKSQMFCSSCHDVSNPVLASVTMSIDTPEKQAPQSYFHVERTSSEFMLSDYGSGGASTNIPGVPFADSCQDCHMRDVTGKGCNKRGALIRDDLPLHDFTGGNQWILGILATADQSSANYDEYNYQILSGQKYEGAQIEVNGIQGYGQELADGSDRATQQLEMAATLTKENEDSTTITLKVQNNGGHKLISGFPEGRRMFLNVKFFDSNGDLISEVNPYEPLVTTQDANGNEVYDSGGILTKTDEELVWECQMSSTITNENKTFHFVLGTDRYKDNRIPPKGFDTINMNERLAQPRWEGADAPTYFTPEEYAGGYDEVTIIKPSGTVTWYATLYYQTTSKEYIEFLRDEINGVGTTLTKPVPSGEAEPYIVQTDPFFANLKGWGNAIYDLWLHNSGAAPVTMAQIGDVPAPPCTVDTPTGLQATAGKRSVSLIWNPVDGADGYNVYYSQNGKYTFIKSTTGNTFKDTKLVSKQQFCYVVTAYKICAADSKVESGYSNEACAITN